MPKPPTAAPSARSRTRAAALKRQEEKREKRRTLLELVVAGYTYEHIAEKFRISVATVRREVDAALSAQTPDTPQRYVALQLTRLQKAMLVVDLAMDDGDLRAIPALATLLGQFDRYNGLAALVANARKELQKKAPKPLKLPPAATE